MTHRQPLKTSSKSRLRQLLKVEISTNLTHFTRYYNIVDRLICLMIDILTTHQHILSHTAEEKKC